jgi:hypothetical protein
MNELNVSMDKNAVFADGNKPLSFEEAKNSAKNVDRNQLISKKHLEIDNYQLARMVKYSLYRGDDFAKKVYDFAIENNFTFSLGWDIPICTETVQYSIAEEQQRIASLTLDIREREEKIQMLKKFKKVIKNENATN